MSSVEVKCEFCGCSEGSTVCYYDCGCHKSKDGKATNVDFKSTKIKEEKCEFCGCRGTNTICYYNCGCHKPTDDKVLPKK